MNRLNICFVTSTRADYGLLKSVMLKVNEFFHLQLIVTGTHLSKKYDLTYKSIEKDGFYIDKMIYTDLDNDTPSHLAKQMGYSMSQYSDIFNELKPDLLVVLGDRYEILASVYVATLFSIPVAHLCGGDITEGAYDESIRHAITKLSHLHFVTNEESKRRVIQMGENPDYVFCYGNPGLETFLHFEPIKKKEIEKLLSISFSDQDVVFLYHPETLKSKEENEKDIINISKVLEDRVQKYTQHNIYILGSNADNSNNIIHDILDRLNIYPNVFFFTSLDRNIFLSLVYHSAILVGNSSSGIYEIPFLKKYVINIGDRQKGRLQPNSVIDSSSNSIELKNNIEKVLDLSKKPYDGEQVYPMLHTSELIVTKIKELGDLKQIIVKKYFDPYRSL